jgi:hypothetical protein
MTGSGQSRAWQGIITTTFIQPWKDRLTEIANWRTCRLGPGRVQPPPRARGGARGGTEAITGFLLKRAYRWRVGEGEGPPEVRTRICGHGPCWVAASLALPSWGSRGAGRGPDEDPRAPGPPRSVRVRSKCVKWGKEPESKPYPGLQGELGGSPTTRRLWYSGLHCYTQLVPKTSHRILVKRSHLSDLRREGIEPQRSGLRVVCPMGWPER